MSIYEKFDLTGPQMRVIRLMENGWTLLWSNEISDRRCWIKGPEGEEYTISVPIVNILVEKGVIKQDNAIPLGTFHLVDAE